MQNANIFVDSGPENSKHIVELPCDAHVGWPAAAEVGAACRVACDEDHGDGDAAPAAANGRATDGEVIVLQSFSFNFLSHSLYFI